MDSESRVTFVSNPLIKPSRIIVEWEPISDRYEPLVGVISDFGNGVGIEMIGPASAESSQFLVDLSSLVRHVEDEDPE